MVSEYISNETLSIARESAYWAKLSMFGTWFSGLATFLAVCISLVVAFGRPKPRIRGQVDINIVSSPPYNNHLYGVGVTINNIGVNQVKITSLKWCFSKSVRIMYAVSHPGDSLPKKLEHGDSAQFFFLSDQNGEWLDDMRDWADKAGGRVHKLKVEVTLGTGDVFFIKPTRAVIEFIRSN
ncbi:TPA: hypothetical protein ACPYV0_000094 [Citrobacter amalonaticus]